MRESSREAAEAGRSERRRVRSQKGRQQTIFAGASYGGTNQQLGGGG